VSFVAEQLPRLPRLAALGALAPVCLTAPCRLPLASPLFLVFYPSCSSAPRSNAWTSLLPPFLRARGSWLSLRAVQVQDCAGLHVGLLGLHCPLTPLSSLGSQAQRGICGLAASTSCSRLCWTARPSRTPPDRACAAASNTSSRVRIPPPPRAAHQSSHRHSLRSTASPLTQACARCRD
jgi:hypothetical protein